MRTDVFRFLNRTLFGSPFSHYGLAVAAALAALLLRWALDPVLGIAIPYVTLYPVVMLVAITLGTVPAIVTTIVGVGLAEVWFVDPMGRVMLTASLAARFTILILTSLYVGHVGEKLRAARVAAEAEAKASREAEETLRLSERKFSVIYESAPYAIGLAKLPDGVIVDVNQAWLDLFGFSKEEVIGKTGVELGIVHEPETRARTLDELQQRGSVRDREATVFTRSGEQLIVSGNADVIELGGRKYLLATLVDITKRRQTEEELRKSEQRFRAIFDQTYQFIGLMTSDGVLIQANRAALKFGGVEESDVVGKSFWETPWWTHSAEQRERLREAVKKAAEGEFVRFETHHRAADGTLHNIDFSLKPVFDDAGNVVLLIPEGRDITERKQAEESIRRSETILKQAGQMANLGAWIIEISNYDDLNANPLSWSDEVFRIFGYKPGAVEATNDLFFQRVHPDDRRRIMDAVAQAIALKQPYSIEHRIIRPDGTERIVFEHAEITFDNKGRPVRIIGAIQDITERKKLEEEIKYQAHHDALTGLPNRRFFIDILAIELVKARRSREKFAVLFLDLDRFKYINDTLGHDIGDELLKGVAERIRHSIRGSDTIARLGGDEFNILLTDISHTADIIVIAKKIVDSFRESYMVRDHALHVTTSIGISIYPDDSENIEGLFKNADIAMYHAKGLGGNAYQFYDPVMNIRTVERIRLEGWLRQAIHRGELEVYYQPQITTDTKQVVGAEALVRWRHPEQGLLDPKHFIPLAEETGFIAAIDEWVLRTACKQFKEWQKAGIPNVWVTVNLSAKQFQKTDLVERISLILRETGFDPNRLDLEITESTAMKSPEQTIHNMNRLAEIGVGISIDDFGTGYSSLSYLKKLPIQKLKIDQSFVRDIATDSDDRAIISAVTAMAQNMKLKVIAEGVETEEQLEFLKSVGCREMQGFLFSRPLPAHEFKELIGNGNR